MRAGDDLDAEDRRQVDDTALARAEIGDLRLVDHDDALVELRRAVEHETGIPENLTDTIVDALRGADHLEQVLAEAQTIVGDAFAAAGLS